MESAVARFKRLKNLSANGASSSTPPSKNDTALSIESPSAPAASLEAMSQQTFLAQSAEVEPKQMPPVSVDTVPHGRGQSFLTNDSALGESLSEADTPKGEAPLQDETINAQRGNSQVHTAGEVQSPTGKRRGRPLGSKNKERPTPRSPQIGPRGDQYQSTPINETEIKNNATPDKTKKISEAMKASWARRRNESDDLRQRPFSGKTSSERRNHQDFSVEGNRIIREAPLNAPRRQLFQGQHAIRSGSGAKLPEPASKRSSTTEAKPHKTTLHDAERHHPVPKQLAQPSDASRGPDLHDPPSICKGDVYLIAIYRTIVQPAIIAAMDRYRESVLPTYTLLAICKRVSLLF